MQTTIKLNDQTRKIRTALRMKAWNSSVSTFDSDNWLKFALDNLENKPEFYRESAVAYAIALSRARGILDGELELALRKLTGWQMSVIVGSFSEWCERHDDVIYSLRFWRDNIIAMAK